MKTHVRAVVAYAAGRLISGRTASSIYDYSQNGHRMIDGTVGPNSVNVFDYKQACHFGGSGSGNSFDLFHYGESCHISLVVKGSHFEGFDYGSSSHYSGDVNGTSISVYDYGESMHFSYLL